jgi:hypothetical protein
MSMTICDSTLPNEEGNFNLNNPNICFYSNFNNPLSNYELASRTYIITFVLRYNFPPLYLIVGSHVDS